MESIPPPRAKDPRRALSGLECWVRPMLRTRNVWSDELHENEIHDGCEIWDAESFGAFRQPWSILAYL